MPQPDISFQAASFSSGWIYCADAGYDEGTLDPDRPTDTDSGVVEDTVRAGLPALRAEIEFPHRAALLPGSDLSDISLSTGREGLAAKTADIRFAWTILDRGNSTPAQPGGSRAPADRPVGHR